jgi:hypothetical protein
MESKELQEALILMDQNLKKPTRLHIRGGCACILHGEEFRSTTDIDAIPTASSFDPEDLAQACKKSGILLDPENLNDPEHIQSGEPFLQLLTEENLVLPKEKPKSRMTLWQGGKLQITAPPPADIIVSKLRRCDAVDIQDIAFLLLRFEIKAPEIQEAFQRLPKELKNDPILRKNLENTLHDFFDSFEPSPCPPNGKPKRRVKPDPTPLEKE